jgi:hypothetical protein
MQTRLHDYKGITFGYTTPVGIGDMISLNIIEIPSQANSDWPNLPKYNQRGLIEPHLQELIPVVLDLIAPELLRLKQMSGANHFTFKWLYFDLRQKAHPIPI